MNLGFRTRYLARIWLDASAVTREQGADLAERIADPALDVTSLLEPRGDDFVRRVLLNSDSAGLALALLTKSFDFTLMPTVETAGANMGSFAAFASLGARVLGHALDVVGTKAHRIALVEEGLFPAMTEGKMQSIERALLRTPNAFRAPPFEWDFRAAAHHEMTIAGAQETTNVIAVVKRTVVIIKEPMPSEMGGDRIFATLDVNTAPGDLTPRFTSAHIAEFFRRALEEHEVVGSALERSWEGG